MFIIRAILGALILFFDWVFTPRGIKRVQEKQQLVDGQTQNLTLYQFKACPFCVKVRRAMKRQSLKIETRDAKRCNDSREALLQGGGKIKVPCLRIEDSEGNEQWMYESSDIIAYLQQRFA
mgnify:CR=1 FL=1